MKIYNWLRYGPPPGFGDYPWVFRRDVLDPLFGSRQPHFCFEVDCFEDSDPLKPQPQRVVERVEGMQASSIGHHYDRVVILDIEATDFVNLDRNWEPMLPQEPNGAFVFRLEPNAMAKLMWFVSEVKRGLGSGYAVGLWSHLPNRRMELLFHSTQERRDQWWSQALALYPLGQIVDFCSPCFYWNLEPGDPYYFTPEHRERGIMLSCMACREIYGYDKPVFPCVWPECIGKFRTDPWPDTPERALARQWTAEDATNTLGACSKYADGVVLYSQPLASAPLVWNSSRKEPTPFRFDYPWVPELAKGVM